MGVSTLTASFACGGLAAIAVIALLHAHRSVLAVPLAVLAANLFTWNLALIVANFSTSDFWPWLDATATPLTLPLGLDFILTFVGRKRALRSVRLAAYGYFCALCVLSAASAISPVARGLTRGNAVTYPLLLLIGAVPVIVFAAALLVRHLRATADPRESARTRLLLVAMPLGGALGTTEYLINPLASFGVSLPHLGSVGALTCTMFMAVVALRLRLFGNELSTSVAAARHGEFASLASVGRVAVQMAHDFKNPLAALKGSIQFLREERARGRSIDDRLDFLDLMLEQVDRLEKVTAGYQRLWRIEPLRTEIDVRSLLQDVLELRRRGHEDGVRVDAEISAEVSTIRGDRDLLARALDNLLCNAREAISGRGSVVVRAEPADPPRGLVICVEDSGCGMDARVRERAFDDFFTTKPTGSGLGLTFVRRVVEAHGGEVAILDRRGGGTIVRLRIPDDLRS